MQKSSLKPWGKFLPPHVDRTSDASPTANSKGAPNASEAKTLKRRNRTHKRAEAAIPSLPKELQRPPRRPRRPRNANTSAKADPFGHGDMLEQIVNAKSLKALDQALASPEGQRLSAMSDLKHSPDAAFLKELTSAQPGADLDKVLRERQFRPLSPVGSETARFDAAPLRQRRNKR